MRERSEGMRRLLLGTVLAVLGCGGSAAPTLTSAVVASEPAPATVTVSGACTPTPGRDLTLAPVAVHLRKPVLLTSPPGDDRLFVIEQPGRIRILDDAAPAPHVFLDIRRKVESGFGEQGLLGLAFHPKYAENGRFFVNYTELRTGTTVVAEYRVGEDPNAARPEEKRLLTVRQPFANHNGGHIAFDPEGRLVVGLGDGGSGGDPQGHGQNAETLLGSFVRLDVDAAQPTPEPFAIGLRNPWRFSFDRATGDLWIGDVGQRSFEEIDRIPAGVSGVNLGWNVAEGRHCYGADECDQSGFLAPVVEVPRTGSCDSITGGYVYRGSCLPDLVGTYFYGDYCDNWVRSVTLDADGAVADSADWTDSLGVRLRGLSSFGEDARGELYVLSHSDGTVYRLVSRSDG